MEFNSDNVKKITSQYQAWMAEVESTIKLGEEQRNEIIDLIQDNVSRNSYSNWIKTYLDNKTFEMPLDLETYERTFWNYAYCFDSVKNAIKLDKTYRAFILGCLSIISCRKNAFRWLFDKLPAFLLWIKQISDVEFL